MRSHRLVMERGWILAMLEPCPPCPRHIVPVLTSEPRESSSLANSHAANMCHVKIHKIFCINPQCTALSGRTPEILICERAVGIFLRWVQHKQLWPMPVVCCRVMSTSALPVSILPPYAVPSIIFYAGGFLGRPTVGYQRMLE